MKRFDRVQQFASYARLVKCAKESAGKRQGTSGAKMGNVHLKWAFSEAAVLFVRHSAEGKKLLAETQTRPRCPRVHTARTRAGREPEDPAARALDWTLARTPFSSVVSIRLCPSPEPGDNGPLRSSS